MAATALEVLLVEDNPGDARLVEEMLRDAKHLLHRIDLDRGPPERITFHHELDLPAGLDHLSTGDPDVVLLDLGLPSSTGLDTLSRVVEGTTFTPVVVLTGLDDRDRGIQAIQEGAEDYLVKDEVTGELLIHSIQYAIEQTRQERERVRYREQLEALNELNTISQQITHDVITTSSRGDLEQAVCERLVELTAYQFAWIGEVNWRTEQLTPRVTAGAGGMSDEFAIPVGGEASGERPEARAVSAQEAQIRQEIRTGAGSDPFQGFPGESEHRSVTAVPLTYRSISYGILAIYAASPNPFSEHEAEVLSRLGDVIAHAITSIERKNALVSDTALELTFRVEGPFEKLVALSANRASTLEFENFIRSDEASLVYGQAEGLSQEGFRDLARELSAIEDLRILSSGQDGYEFEFLTRAMNSLDTAVATQGGHVTSASIDSGTFRFTVEFPPGRDKRQLVELVEDNCAGATLEAHRTVERDEPSVPESRSVFQNRLTEKQRVALEAAFYAGYFEWPRTANGDEIAQRLGITQATFSQHLRAAEREFFGAVFEDEDDDSLPSSPWKSSEPEVEDD